MSKAKLKPCPWCESPPNPFPLPELWQVIFAPWWFVECPGCRLRKHGLTRAHAVRRWNTRRGEKP